MKFQVETNKLLKQARKTMTTKAIAEGSGTGYEWLAKYQQGVITDPKISNLQKLYDYLARVDRARVAREKRTQRLQDEAIKRQHFA